MSLAGRVAVVTGGSGVLGGAICAALAESGAVVVVLGRSLEKARTVADRLPGLAVPLACDVLDRASLLAARDAVGAAVGLADILVNAAGGNHPSASTSTDRSFFDVDDGALARLMDLNYLGTVRACQVFGADLVAKGEGAIVNIASMASARPVTRGLGYSAAKAAVVNFTQWLAVHLAQEYGPGIRVNALAPGFFLTEQNRYLMLDEHGRLTPRAETIVGHTPMARLGDPSDLASTLLWLVSPASRFVTGTVVPVDGGFSAFGGV